MTWRQTRCRSTPSPITSLQTSTSGKEWGVEGAHASHTHVHLRAAAAQSDVGERPPFGVVIAVMLVLGG
jgi:hypothetical protein